MSLHVDREWKTTHNSTSHRFQDHRGTSQGTRALLWSPVTLEQHARISVATETKRESPSGHQSLYDPLADVTSSSMGKRTLQSYYYGQKILGHVHIKFPIVLLHLI